MWSYVVNGDLLSSAILASEPQLHAKSRCSALEVFVAIMRGMKDLAFIGLGIMGLPMAGHLLAAGHRVTVHSRTKSKAQPLLEKGAVWAESPAEAARAAEVVFTCVTDTPDVRNVLLGDRGVMSVAKPGLIVVDHSTISPTATREMADDLARSGATLLDAPISGGDIGARNATLAIMVGGDAAAFDRVKPLLAIMGKSITYCGDSGKGQLTKLANQIFVVIANLAMCEGLTFARAAGLDEQKTIDAVVGGAAGSWQLANLGPRIVRGDFNPGFMIKLQTKDLRLVGEAMKERGISLAGLELVHRYFDSLQARGEGNKGTQLLFQAVDQAARKV
jgi:3-hydroxyisobutyrate dehydrogenase